ncbi:thioredoxin family protein [Mesomycoplasma lagogenitalium]|uniref:Thioredoxin family protein n=1 Tax=Mesomycoplasma lagogenitalium TaxID=171286 RepID=A0ABY8LWK1_9BACT|nr:thioredoxin family protein [Mesomycoplasma lagogenitalium]WGI36678.1 thioredoxin family protein [Mesomycoplasma lagogenitalium]
MKIQKMSWADAQKVIDNGVVYLEFTTEWCGDCKMMAPVVKQVEQHFQNEERIKMINVDAEEAKLFRQANTRFEVLRVPTHIVMKDGKILNKGFEYFPKDILIEWIDQALKK